MAALARPPLLDVYKKLSIVFKSTDSVVYEDLEGNVKSVPVGDLGEVALTAVSNQFYLFDLFHFLHLPRSGAFVCHLQQDFNLIILVYVVDAFPF